MAKRVSALFLAVTMLLGFAACGTSPQFDEEKLKQKSVEFATQFTDGNFETVVESFSDTMKSSITSQQLKDGWNQTAGSLGKYKQVHSTQVNVTPTSAQVNVILEFEENGLLISFTYGKEEKIDGLWMNYSALTNNLVNNDKLEETEIAVKSDKIELTGVLTLPKTDNCTTVAILVQGSGSTDFNETISANKPFRDIAHSLAEQNIATIRYNKRFYQNPGLASSAITIEDEVLTDVNAAIALAKSDTRLAGKKIVIIGHSLGGMLAPKIAKDNPDVKGIVALAGSPRKLEDIIYDQNKQAIDKMSDKTAKEKEALLKSVKTEVDKVKALTGSETTGTILDAPVSYWNSLNKIDTNQIVKELNIPILIMQGSADFQVSKTDYNAWKTTLKDYKDVTYKWYDNLNHLFMKSNGKTDITEYEKKDTVDSQVLQDLAQWINKLNSNA